MAKSLDQLLDFLLEEIALNGDQGVALRDVVRCVKNFYAEPAPSSLSSSPTSSLVDRRFIAKLWKWLSQHGDVSVGKDHECDNLTLDEIEVQYPGILVDSDIAPVQPTGANAPSSTQQAVALRVDDGPRICVSKELIYYAIVGHAPDPTRVFPSEYELLCGIAAARYDGILQGELRRLTGQDKRSVPKRTDALHEKGYIVKRTVFAGGHKTSRLFLRRFAKPLATSDSSEQGGFRLKDLSLQVFSALKANPLMAQEDFSSLLGMANPAKGRVLAQILRHFVRKGCLKKTKTAFGPGSKSADLKLCFQIVREPAEGDWEKDGMVNLDLELPVDDAVEAAKQDDDPQDESLTEVQQDEQEIQTSLRTPAPTHRPWWNPDRTLTNVCFDLASVAGEAGVTNMNVRQELTGLSVRRPLESLLVRLSHLALRSQSSVVPDVTIVRTSELKDGVSHYVHRTFDTYREMVKQGVATWEALEGGDDFAKNLEQTPDGDPLQLLQLDKHGFVHRLQPKGQVQNGEVCMEDLVKMTSAATLIVKGGDLILSNNPSGQPCLSAKPYTTGERVFKGPYPVSPRVKTQAPSTVTKRDGRGGVRGGNRKFVEGTWEFWREMFYLAKLEEDPAFPKNGIGYMKDPLGLKMYSNRPLEIDQCILTSIAEHLPLPSRLQDISQEWIDKMNTFSHRANPGLYMTPTGMRGYRRPPIKSRIVVLRSDRLRQLDFSTRSNPPKVFFNSSSVAHTQRNNRFARWWNTISEERLVEIRLPTEGDRPTRRGRPPGPTPARPRSSQPAVPIGLDPARGSFCESVDPSTPTPVHTLVLNGQSIRPEAISNSMLDGNDTDATATDLELPQREAQAVEQKAKARQTRKIEKSRNCETNHATLTNPSAERGGRRRKPTRRAIESAMSLARQEESSRIATSADSPTKSHVEIDEPVVAFPHHAVMPRPEPMPEALESGSADASATKTDEMQFGFTVSGPHSSLESEVDHVVHGPPEKTPPIPANKQTHEAGLHTDAARVDASINMSESAPVPDESAAPDDFIPILPIPKDSATPTAFLSTGVEDAELYQSPDSSGLAQAYGLFDASQQPQSYLPAASAVAAAVVQSLPLTAEELTNTSAPPAYQDNQVCTAASPAPQAENDSNPVIKQACISHASQDNATIEVGLNINPIRQGVEVTPRPSPTSSRSQKTAKFLDSRHSTKWYRKILMELVRMCDGVVPDNASTMKRAMQPKCIEANVEATPNIKNTKSQIEALIRNGQLKDMIFAYQRNGMIYKKKLLALPHVRPTDAQFLAMTDKIRTMPVEDDYVPPELAAESVRKPAGVIGRYETSDSDSEGLAGAGPKRKKKKSAPRQHRESTIDSSVRRLSFTPEPDVLSPNNGFLTLKIPKHRLESLRLPDTFTTNYFRLPAVPLRFETDATRVASTTAAPTPLSERRSGVRLPQSTRNIQWRTPKLTPLPRTLKTILSQDRRKLDTEVAFSENPALFKFETEIEFVSRWEQRKWNDFQERKSGEWLFINHQISRKEFPFVAMEDEPVFRTVEFDQHGEMFEIYPPVSVSWEIFQDVLATTGIKKKKAAEMHARRKRKFEELDGRDGDEDVSDYDGPAGEAPVSKRKRQSKESKKRKAGTDLDVRRKKKTRMETRGIGMRHLSPEQAHSLSIAIVVAKVLAGGLERHLDLNLVARLFTEEPLTLLRERWKVIATRYMAEIDTLSRDFQAKYLDALADDKVPSVNFDDLQSTDWEGIHRWAVTNVSKEDSKDSVLELPPTRDELLTLNELEVEESAPIRNLYMHNLSYSQPVREDAWCTVVFGDTPGAGGMHVSNHIVPCFPAEDADHDLVLARARSWVLAAILTPKNSFDPVKAQEKLLKLADSRQECEKLLETTLKKLQTDRIVVKKSNTDAEVMIDGTTYSGTHGWKVSSKFFDRLDSQRNISPSMLKQATKYKFEVLDPAFSRNEAVNIAKDADIHDGEMVAILNLLSMDMVQIRPGSDVPASRYGLDWEKQEYKTKSMDKNLLSFTTILEPTATYIYNDPFLDERQAVPVPIGGIDQDDGLIPVWFDINHDFRPEIWEMVLGAVVGLISVRPGVSTTEIMRSLTWAIPLRDIEMVIQFLFDCRFVARTHVGWESTEWWWLAISTGHENGVVWNLRNDA